MKRLLLTMLAGLALWHCATDPEDLPKLVMKAPDTLTMAPGDTSAFIDAVKTVQDARGRQQDIDPYFFILLVSDDTAVVAVDSEHRLVARKPGSASVYAKDTENDQLRSRNTLKVTVRDPGKLSGP